MIHEEKLAVISTGHLPADEALYLMAAINEGAVNGMQREEGWMVHAHRPYENFINLNFVLGYLRAKGFDWVLFDRDASATEELPTYDW